MIVNHTWLMRIRLAPLKRAPTAQASQKGLLLFFFRDDAYSPSWPNRLILIIVGIDNQRLVWVPCDSYAEQIVASAEKQKEWEDYERKFAEYHRQAGGANGAPTGPEGGEEPEIGAGAGTGVSGSGDENENNDTDGNGLEGEDEDKEEVWHLPSQHGLINMGF
jgi:hypothetical protein